MLYFTDIFNVVCPLGTKCHTAYFLKRNKLKKSSFPFDWITTTPNFINYCLTYGFDLFFNDSNYEIYKNGWINTSYKKNLIFFHKKPTEHVDYFDRCICRLNNLLSNDNRKLFVMFFFNQKLNNNKIDEIKEFNSVFKKFTNNYKLFCLFQKCYTFREYEFLKSKEIDFLKLKTISNSNGVCFENEEDNVYLDSIFLKIYKFKLEY